MNKNSNHLIKITDDLFGIAERIKSIRQGYVIYYNLKQHRYEVYDNGVFAFAVPYLNLDKRTLDYARYTSVGRADDIIAEMDKSNAETTENTVRSIVEETMRKMNLRR